MGASWNLWAGVGALHSLEAVSFGKSYREEVSG